MDGGDEWINYVDTESQDNDDNPVVDDYSMDMLRDNHKR